MSEIDEDAPCKKCGEFMTTPFGLEPTEYCNLCAQDLVMEFEQDKARLDWLIKQGPEGACEGMGLNGDVWEGAYQMSPNPDTVAVRAAIDAAMKGEK